MSQRKYNISEGELLNIKRPEVAYYLGLLWADGNISKSHYIFTLTCVKEDLEYISNFFNTFSNFGRFYRYKKNKRKEQLTLHVSNKEIYNFLLQHDYKAKSWKSADKILSKIPAHLQHYWWRGYFDGDGCIHLHDSGTHQLFFTSGIRQRWEFAKKICKKLGIKYSVSKTIETKTGNKNSRFKIQNIDGIIKFCKYLYLNFEDDMCFNRKRQKYLELLNKVKYKERDQLLNIKGYSFSKHFNSFVAKFYFRSKCRWVGYFETEESAKLAIQKRKEELYIRFCVPKELAFDKIYTLRNIVQN